MDGTGPLVHPLEPRESTQLVCVYDEIRLAECSGPSTRAPAHCHQMGPADCEQTNGRGRRGVLRKARAHLLWGTKRARLASHPPPKSNRATAGACCHPGDQRTHPSTGDPRPPNLRASEGDPIAKARGRSAPCACTASGGDPLGRTPARPFHSGTAQTFKPPRQAASCQPAAFDAACRLASCTQPAPHLRARRRCPFPARPRFPHHSLLPCPARAAHNTDTTLSPTSAAS